MQIQINSIRENHNDRTVFWTLTDDTDTAYPWHSDIPKGGDAQDHLDRAISKYLLLIRKREYRTLTLNRDYVIDPGQSQLEAIEEWISDGCMLRDDEGQYTEQLDPLEWVSTHPEPELSDELIATLNAANSPTKLRDWLKSFFHVT